jgi:hypothetical protein
MRQRIRQHQRTRLSTCVSERDRVGLACKGDDFLVMTPDDADKLVELGAELERMRQADESEDEDGDGSLFERQ